MNLLYPVHYRRDEENSELWEATIPGLDGTLEGPGTCGDNLEDCRKMAGGLVDAWLVTHMKQGNPIPIPGDLPVGDGWEQVGPSLRVAWVATLCRLREQSGMTQDEAATKLNVKLPYVGSSSWTVSDFFHGWML